MATTQGDRRRIKQAVSAYHKGVPIKDITRRYGVSTATIYRHIKKRRGWPMQISQGVQNAIATQNYRGKNDSQIARRLGVTKDTVKRHRELMGLPRITKEH